MRRKQINEQDKEEIVHTIYSLILNAAEWENGQGLFILSLVRHGMESYLELVENVKNTLPFILDDYFHFIALAC